MIAKLEMIFQVSFLPLGSLTISITVLYLLVLLLLLNFYALLSLLVSLKFLILGEIYNPADAGAIVQAQWWLCRVLQRFS